ncbi:hypothetical protein PAMP_011228 [Pampus punctatissimus]
MSANRDLGLGLVLGTDYERKKQKLQQELQLDYKHYVATKKDLKTTEPHPQPQSLSLPIDERVSVKEKLREERKKEYNLFLQGQTQTRRLKRGTSPVTYKPGHVQPSDDVCISSPTSPLPILNNHTHELRSHRERAPSRRDAATLTEAGDTGNNEKSTGTWSPEHQGRRCWQRRRPKEHYSSEDELNLDKDKELDLRHSRWQDTHTPEPKYKEARRTREHKANRDPQDIKGVEAPGVHDQNNNERVWKSDSLQKPDRMRVAMRSRPATSKDEVKFATGLMIGATEEQTTSQMRKEQYKQELLKQIAEQQINKKREKQLELKVAATGATDPEKKPDRIQQFGAVNRHHDSCRHDVSYKPIKGVEATGKDPYPTPKADKPIENTEQRASTGKSRVAFPSLNVDNNTALSQPGSGSGAALGGPSLGYFKEDYHRDFSDMLGGVAISRATDHHRASPLIVGELSADISMQRRESAINYQEALRQQIKESQERKRKEKEEKERYDAKIEAEIKAYNPWGRSGGGAPIKDQRGNLVSDLNHMHRVNENFMTRNGPAPVVEARAPLSHRISGFTDPPTQQQLHMHDTYKEALKQQIEENRLKQSEERERIRIEEEKEEKRLADQRARIRQEYEEEQRKQKKIGHGLENQSWIHESKTHHLMEEKKAREKQEIERRAPESGRDKEEKQALVENEERSVSAPHFRPVPAKTHQQQDGQQEVLRELSALRRYLRKEQKQLEVQLRQTDRQERHYTPPSRPRGRPQVDAFEPVNKQAVKPLTRSPSSGAARVNMQTIREFNQLKYRDTASREEVCHMFPDPPTDAQSLDIQQQALLRAQQRKISLMKKEEEHDYLDQQLRQHHPEAGVSLDQRERDIQPGHSLQSATGLNLESEVRARNQQHSSRHDSCIGDHKSRSEGMSGDEVDVLSLCSALERRVSVDTVATEAWLRPGTSDAVKPSGCKERPGRRRDTPPWLTHRIT